MSEEKSKKKTFTFDEIKKRRVTFRKMPFIVIMLVSFIMVGLSELVKPEFSWEVFTSSTYWYNVVLSNFSYILMAISATLMFSDEIITKDETGEIGKISGTLMDISPDLQKSDVDIFLYEVNHARKRKAWENKIQRKLYKLERKVNEANTNNYVKYIETHDKKYLTKYVKQKEQLLFYMSEEFIADKLDCLQVKYTKITRKLITNGNFGNHEEDVPNKPAVVMVNGILPKFLLTFSFTTFLLSFGLDFTTLSWLSILPILIKVISLVMNFVYGRDFAPQYVKDTTIDGLYIRIRWVTKYTEWKKAQNPKPIVDAVPHLEPLDYAE